jgi:hypothetical protein
MVMVDGEVAADAVPAATNAPPTLSSAVAPAVAVSRRIFELMRVPPCRASGPALVVGPRFSFRDERARQ